MGNLNGPNDVVSLYLDHVKSPDEPEDWHVCAQFMLIMANPTDQNVIVSNQAHHRFIPEECDWGFTKFSELSKLYKPAPGQTRPIIENEACMIYAYVRVFSDPTGVLWHNFNNYDSKKETGHVGLKNQGATCYMNSLLQSLYYTNAFRKAVFQLPTDEDTPTESVALALQRVFYQLQSSELPVGTIELTKSFGWRTLDAFLQHDVQEFNRVLQDKLETKMKGTNADGAIQNLFAGKMLSYIKCINVPFESKRTEQFYDIQLNVKGFKTLQDSFADYIAVEDMNGENRYMAEGYGLQDVKKGVIFESFPPVLHLQLKRFEFDMQKEDNVKINDRFEFPLEIDLSPYLDPTSTSANAQSAKYALHGVLVHSGDVNGGHYFALIKPEADGDWYKYDDDRVTRATEREVLEDNFGGEYVALAGPGVKPQSKTAGGQKRFTNAYMLVYIRISDLPTVLAPITEEDTPAHLKRRLEDERALVESKKRDREEQHLYLTVRLVNDEFFEDYEGFDLALFDDSTLPLTDVPAIKVKKTETYQDFIKSIVATYGLPADVKFTNWVMINRQNKTVRPDAPIPDNDPTLTMEGIHRNMTARGDLRFWFTESRPTQANQILIFIKYFDVGKQSLRGKNSIFIDKNATVAQLITAVNAELGYPPHCPIKLYEEIKPGTIDPITNMTASLKQLELQNGDIVCAQVELNEKEINSLAAKGMMTDPIQYYDYLANRIAVRFRPKTEAAGGGNQSDVDLVLSRKYTYDVMAKKLATLLNYDEMKLRFTVSGFRQPIKRTANQTVGEICAPLLNNASKGPPLLLFEMLDVTITELETKKSLKVIWTGSQNHEESSYPFLLPKTSNVHDLIENLTKVLPPDALGVGGKVRIFEIGPNCRSQRVYTNAEMIGNIPDGVDLYAELIAPEELNKTDDEKVISVFHFSKEPLRWHGIPFKLVLRAGEPFIETKKRIQERVNMVDKEFAKVKFCLVHAQTYRQPSAVEETDILYDHRFASDDVLGMDHLDKSGRSSKNGEYRALNIK